MPRRHVTTLHLKSSQHAAHHPSPPHVTTWRQITSATSTHYSTTRHSTPQHASARHYTARRHTTTQPDHSQHHNPRRHNNSRLHDSHHRTPALGVMALHLKTNQHTPRRHANTSHGTPKHDTPAHFTARLHIRAAHDKSQLGGVSGLARTPAPSLRRSARLSQAAQQRS